MPQKQKNRQTDQSIPAWFFVFIFILNVTALSSAHAQTGCIEVAFSNTSKAIRVAQNIIQDAYKQAGLCLEFKKIPNKRAQSMLLSGLIDGNLWRSNNFIAQHKKQVLQIDPPLATFHSVIVYNEHKYQAPFANNIFKNRSVGVLLGCPQGKAIAQKIGAIPVEVHYYEMMLGMLKVGRLDAIVMPYEYYQTLVHTAPLPANYIIAPQEPFTLYHTVHKSHADKLLRLNEAFKNILSQQDFFERLSTR